MFFYDTGTTSYFLTVWNVILTSYLNLLVEISLFCFFLTLAYVVLFQPGCLPSRCAYKQRSMLILFGFVIIFLFSWSSEEQHASSN